MLSAVTPPIHSSKKKNPSSSVRKQPHLTPNRNKAPFGSYGNKQLSTFSSPLQHHSTLHSSIIAHPEDSMILSDDVVPSINNNNTEATTTNSHNIQSDYAISDEDKALTIEEFLLKKVKLNNEELMRRMNQMIEKIQSVGAKNIRDIEQTFQALKLNK